MRRAGGEVALLGADVIAGVGGLEVDGAEGSVGLEVGGAVDEVVLAAELFFDVVEADSDVFEFDGIEGLAAGGFGDGFEDVVALVFAGADVGADGVDDGIGALTHLDGVGLFDAAVVVVAVGDEDEGAADGCGLLQGEHLVATGFVERIEECGAAAGAEFADALVEEVDVIGEVLGYVGLDVEAFDEGAVVAMEDLEEELDGGVLLELEALADGAGGVEHDADTQGKIGLLSEAEDSERGTTVVEEAEVFALEAGDEFTVLVDDGEDEIDFVDLDLEGGDGLVDLRGIRRGSLAGLSGSLGGGLSGGCSRLLGGCGGWRGAGWRCRMRRRGDVASWAFESGWSGPEEVRR